VRRVYVVYLDGRSEALREETRAEKEQAVSLT
jgi:hypothetical protein